jgi:hypothetical protein
MVLRSLMLTNESVKVFRDLKWFAGSQMVLRSRELADESPMVLRGLRWFGGSQMAPLGSTSSCSIASLLLGASW